MKITFFSADPGNHRFIQPIIDRLSVAGYECQLMNNWTHTDADIYWFDFCDNNLIEASKDPSLDEKKVIARLHSVEAYMGYHKQIDWSRVDHLIFVSDHLRRKCADADYKTCQVHVINNGIDLNKFTFNQKPYETHNFAYVGNIVPQKGLLSVAPLFNMEPAPEARFYLTGLSRMHGREGEYWEHFKELDNRIVEEGPTDDVNAWLDRKEIRYLLQPSYSESFSLIIAEAMAKGIKPIINDFVGCRELWPAELIYTNALQFWAIASSEYDPQYYRDWVTDLYNIDKKVEEIKDLLK